MQRTKIKELKKNLNKDVSISGWIKIRRDQGKMVFFDIRDASGIVQGVVLPKSPALDNAKKTRPEFVVQIKGKVNKRPEKNIQEEKQNGDIELEINEINIINPAKTLPFEIEETKEVEESTRLKYRYLDLRSPRLQENIKMRYRVIRFFREYMHKEGFVEIETPILMKGTPEGSREYVVPSRLEKGKFYVLPQSPQQFKQLCMVAGFEKYFQIARCFRDEDTRGDRQPEFTQLDYEMAFVTQEDVLNFTEKMFIELIKEVYPQKKISQIPFPRISYEDAMKKYGSDKPDLRKDKNDPDELAFAWILDFPMFEKDDEGNITTAHHPFCSVKDEDKEKLMSGENLFSIKANSYDLVLNGYELSSGSIRIHESEVQQKVFEHLNISKKDQLEKFGHMLEAFEYGTPPHGGFAPGIDRVVMILQNEPNIREVIPFPKTGEGKDLLMGAPSVLDKKRLKELGL
jgi:aspartyl-tRNA synthetase